MLNVLKKKRSLNMMYMYYKSNL